jgi:hypothetical protein
METKDIKELMLLFNIRFDNGFAFLDCFDKKSNYLDVTARPEDSYFNVKLLKDGKEITLTDEQYNMICKHVENEYYEHHSNNTAFTDDDIEHFNSLIN